MSIQHGIGAVPSEGTRFKSTTYALKDDNYTAWCCRMKAVFIVNNVWDIVNGTRTRPLPPPVLRLGTSHSTGNEAVVKEANRLIAEFEGGSNRAGCFLAESICDKILLTVSNILPDPAVNSNKILLVNQSWSMNQRKRRSCPSSTRSLNLQRR